MLQREPAGVEFQHKWRGYGAMRIARSGLLYMGPMAREGGGRR